MSASITRQPPIPPITAPPVFRGTGLTHAGRVRERNEDAILTDPEGVLWAVADGMGGYGHGDVAADIVIEHIAGLSDDALAAPGLRMRIEEANRAILARAADAGMNRMGAAVVAAMIKNSIATIAWVGDCRAYLWRRGILRLLTRDHSVVQEMVDQGLLRDEERELHPERHVVTRAVGIDAQVRVDTVSVPVIAGDRMLLCSDGLTTCLPDQEIAAIISDAADPEGLCRALVMRALELGAPDNVSVIGVFASGDG
ncbi:protein phosphatase [Paracoccus alcaliphilus]|mgnify:CR=1 FL=1|uniref:Protein phosphatase n=1 Tax=Paracoccus alcaliphilus TaxID=34002 RepID=A0A1H8EFD6_9RHOB|nr:protein phosphatase 2C domain-containing protein [Paracoccus alcaliphilus]WCR20961.1 serine/threonine-protein phosphatase [Paracoccus alcaliphilus]SEN18116.1 protein phosphatase [Paracoccus alcaliphilus]